MASVTAALSRIMGGTRASKRMLLARSIILDASPIWADALKTKTCARQMGSLNRLGVRVVFVSAYRTVFDHAA